MSEKKTELEVKRDPARAVGVAVPIGSLSDPCAARSTV